MHATDEVYELKRVHVTTYDRNKLVSCDSGAPNCLCKQCRALWLYAMLFAYKASNILECQLQLQLQEMFCELWLRDELKK